jgi:hypothetical protein
MSTIPRVGQPSTPLTRKNLKAGAQRVWWTPEAEADLLRLIDDPSVREALKSNANVTLRQFKASADTDRRSEGIEGKVMWRRGWDHETERRQSWRPDLADDGPWNYVLFYRSADVPAKFVVLALRSRFQIGERILEQIQNED